MQQRSTAVPAVLENGRLACSVAAVLARRKDSGILTRVGKMRFILVPPGNQVSPFGLGQNARTTGGAGILPAASLPPSSAVFLPAQDV
jgi:hypothetical protein